MARSAVLERSYGSVKTFWLDKEYIQGQLDKVINTLRADPNVVRVVLFGSFAMNRAVPGSDVDILIVLRSDTRRFIDRITHYMDFFSDVGIAVDIFPYTIHELDNPVAKVALATGKVLFERDE